jgi:hypothetical protein
MITMSPPVMNTTPLFQTSLRDWQAAWRAERGQAAESATPRLTAGTPALHRLGRLKRRTRRHAEARPQE